MKTGLQNERCSLKCSVAEYSLMVAALLLGLAHFDSSHTGRVHPPLLPGHQSHGAYFTRGLARVLHSTSPSARKTKPVDWAVVGRGVLAFSGGNPIIGDVPRSPREIL